MRATVLETDSALYYVLSESGIVSIAPTWTELRKLGGHVKAMILVCSQAKGGEGRLRLVLCSVLIHIVHSIGTYGTFARTDRLCAIGT